MRPAVTCCDLSTCFCWQAWPVKSMQTQTDTNTNSTWLDLFSLLLHTDQLSLQFWDDLVQIFPNEIRSTFSLPPLLCEGILTAAFLKKKSQTAKVCSYLILTDCIYLIAKILTQQVMYNTEQWYRIKLWFWLTICHPSHFHVNHLQRWTLFCLKEIAVK